MSEIEQEIEQLLMKRDELRDKQFKTFAANTFTRAKTTTMNARIGQLNDRIFGLREILASKKAA